MLTSSRAFFARLRVPLWAKPALGGLALGVFATPLILLVAPHVGREGQGLGILGGGYGAAQVAITGASWLPGGWREVQLLLLLGGVKIVATSLTVGSGGSAGDFGPSLVIGGLFGGAFGRGAQLIVDDPRIAPGAFALVGMATFYGGIAHVPLASLVMTCELTGSYDLLVPLMLAEGIAFVALRKRTLYEAQVPTRRDSPAHREELIFDVLRGVPVGEVVVRDREFVSFAPKAVSSFRSPPKKRRTPSSPRWPTRRGKTSSQSSPPTDSSWARSTPTSCAQWRPIPSSRR
jgi:chloride channel protein, CIC family